MAPAVELSSQTFARLQAHAVPLVDNIEMVINRLLDIVEKGSDAESTRGVAGAAVREFNPLMPPELTHTKVLSATLCGQNFARTNWNKLLDSAILEAKKRSKSVEALRRLVVVNCVVGRKEDEGYRYLESAGISVQGQDSNGAWKAIAHIAQQLGCRMEVKFVWREKDGAAHPGVTGQFSIAELRPPKDA